MSITMINVGQPHPLWKPQADAGGAFNDDLGLVVIGLPSPTHAEMDEFKSLGRFGLMKHRRISVYTLVFGQAILVSTPYHASLIGRVDAPAPTGAGEHKLLVLCLVDAPTGETASLRASTISPHLTKMLQHHVCQEVANPISLGDVVRDFQDWKSTYPTPRSVIRASTWCRLGD